MMPAGDDQPSSEELDHKNQMITDYMKNIRTVCAKLVDGLPPAPPPPPPPAAGSFCTLSMLGNGNGAAFFTGLTDVGNVKAALDQLVIMLGHIRHGNWVIQANDAGFAITGEESAAFSTGAAHLQLTLQRISNTIGDRPIPESRGPADLMPWLLDFLGADWHQIASRMNDVLGSNRNVDYMAFLTAFDSDTGDRAGITESVDQSNQERWVCSHPGCYDAPE